MNLGTNEEYIEMINTIDTLNEEIKHGNIITSQSKEAVLTHEMYFDDEHHSIVHHNPGTDGGEIMWHCIFDDNPSQLMPYSAITDMLNSYVVYEARK